MKRIKTAFLWLLIAHAMTRAVALIALSLLSGEVAPAPSGVTGYASAYAPGVMAEVVRARLDNNWWRTPLPHDWYTVEGYVAAMDCARVGEITTIWIAGEQYRVLIADCAGDDGPADRFERMNVVVELDHALWEKTKANRTPQGLPVRLAGG